MKTEETNAFQDNLKKRIDIDFLSVAGHKYHDSMHNIIKETIRLFLSKCYFLHQ